MNPSNRVVPYIPIYGMATYLVVFTLAAMEYPGGSYNYPNDTGYSFVHNFLCDAMLEITPTGEVNPARMTAMISHLILSLTMISFFYVLPEIFPLQNRNTRMIKWFGMGTMTVFSLMFTDLHDQIVTATAILGTVALIPFFIELYRYRHQNLKRLAYVCYALSLTVFTIFETRIGYYHLPFLQKITFVVDASWVIWVSLIVIKRNARQRQLASYT